MKEILRTDRLLLRELTEDDLDDLRELLQDRRVMYAYDHDFSDADVRAWLERQQRRPLGGSRAGQRRHGR